MDWSINSDDHPKGEYEFDEAFRLVRYGIGMATAILATPKVVALTAPLVGLVRRVHDMCTVSDDVARIFEDYEAKGILVDGPALVVRDLVCVVCDLSRMAESVPYRCSYSISHAQRYHSDRHAHIRRHGLPCWPRRVSARHGPKRRWKVISTSCYLRHLAV